MNHPDLRPLTRILAECDAAFLPVRKLRDGARHSAFEVRQVYVERGGLVYTCGGSSADRKAAERQAGALEDAGLLEFVRARGRRAFVRLSSRGDWLARAHCWPSMARTCGHEEMRVAMLCLAANHAAGYENEGAVPEIALCGLEDWGPDAVDRLQTVEEALAPGLLRGFVTSNADVGGRVAYLLTDSGRAWLDDPTLPPRDLPKYSPEEGRRYTDEYVSAIKRLNSQSPTDGEIWIPLSAGLWPEGQPTAPSVLTVDGRPRSLTDFRRRSKRFTLPRSHKD